MIIDTRNLNCDNKTILRNIVINHFGIKHKFKNHIQEINQHPDNAQIPW